MYILSIPLFLSFVRFMLNLASHNNGIVVSNDNYRDLQKEGRADWQDVLNYRSVIDTSLPHPLPPPLSLRGGQSDMMYSTTGQL